MKRLYAGPKDLAAKLQEAATERRFRPVLGRMLASTREYLAERDVPVEPNQTALKFVAKIESAFSASNTTFWSRGARTETLTHTTNVLDIGNPTRNTVLIDFQTAVEVPREFQEELAVAYRARWDNLNLLLGSHEDRTHDDLTGLVSKYGLTNAIEHAVNGHARKLTFIYGDLNDFKYINDTYGHEAGDNHIRHFARVLKETTRALSAENSKNGSKEYLIARLHGDEFVIAGFDMSMQEVFAITQRAQALLQQPSYLEPRQGEKEYKKFTPRRELNWSYGLSETTIDIGDKIIERIEQGLDDADQQMLEQKRMNKARQTNSNTG